MPTRITVSARTAEGRRRPKSLFFSQMICLASSCFVLCALPLTRPARARTPCTPRWPLPGARSRGGRGGRALSQRGRGMLPWRALPGRRVCPQERGNRRRAARQRYARRGARVADMGRVRVPGVPAGERAAAVGFTHLRCLPRRLAPDARGAATLRAVRRGPLQPSPRAGWRVHDVPRGHVLAQPAGGLPRGHRRRAG